MSRFTLEKYRVFPYIAWALVVFFGLFTLALTYNMISTVNAVSAQTSVSAIE